MNLLGLFKNALLFSTLSISLHGEANTELVKEKLSKWIDVRQNIAAASGAWEADEAILKDTKGLLKSELELLNEKLESLELGNSDSAEERRTLGLKKATLKASEEKLIEKVSEYEKKILKLVGMFPSPLKDRLEPLVVRIPKDPNNATLSLGQRLTNILGIVGQADKFNRTLTFVGEKRTLDGGKEVQVSTLYWGLATAYYVDALGKIAGYGTPGSEGWIWTADNAIAPDIAKLIAVYEGVADAQFVPVPVKL